MEIRTALTSQSALLATFVNSAYRGEYSKQGWTTEADLLGGQRTDAVEIERMLHEEGATIELLLSGEAILGCVYLRQEENGVYLGMLTVEPTQQGKGHGQRLMAHAEDWARARQAKLMKMTVIQGRDSLIAYYQRRGWVLTGKTEPFPMDDPKFGLPKQPLLFLEMIKTLA